MQAAAGRGFRFPAVEAAKNAPALQSGRARAQAFRARPADAAVRAAVFISVPARGEGAYIYARAGRHWHSESFADSRVRRMIHYFPYASVSLRLNGR